MDKNQHHDQPFTSDTVDEQIEHLLHQHDQQQSQMRTNAHIIRDLHTLYEEDVDLLARVRERFVSNIAEANKVQEPVDLQQDQARRFHPTELSSASPSSQSVSRRRLSLLAAGLVATFIISSMLAVYNFFGHPGTQVASSQLQQTPSGLYIGSGDRVYRIDQRSGKMLWQYRLQDDRKADFGSHPPVVVLLNTGTDNTVYAISESTVYAIDATRGTLYWSNTLFKRVLSASKPVVSNNRVYVTVNGSVYALNTADGKLLATYKIGTTAEPKQLTPIEWNGGIRYNVGNHHEVAQDAIMTTVNDKILYITKHTTLYALSLPDGKQLWQRPLGQGQYPSALQVVNGQVYVSSNRDGSSKREGYITAFNAQTGTTAWQSKKITDGFVYDITVDHGVIYGSVTGSYVFAYDTRTGKTLWRKDANVMGVSAPPQVDGSTVYITASSETSPSETVVALDAKSGDVKWTYPADLQGKSSISKIVQNGVIYVFENGSGTYALKNDGKTIIWHNQPGDQATDLTIVAVP